MAMKWISRKTPLRSISKDGSVHVTDEFYNTWIAIAGAVIITTGSIIMVHDTFVRQQFWHMWGYVAYGVGTVTLFAMSVLHHGIDADEKTEDLFRLLDYCAIFLMIAGTQTAFILVLMPNKVGWITLAIEWVLCVTGIFLKTVCPRVPKAITTAIYLIMGWMGIIVVPSLYITCGAEALGLLVAGGVIYTIGSAIFMWERPNPVPGIFGFHEIWHLFVLVAALCHFYLIYHYLLPLS